MRIFINEFCGHPFQMALSRELARRGHSVCHVYFADNDSTPKGTVSRLPDDSPTLEIEGLHIKRSFSKHSLLTRRGCDIEYGRVAAAKMERFRADIVLSANMPLDGQRILMNGARRQSAGFIFWLQDVYSEAVRFVLNRKAKILSRIGGKYFEILEKKLLRASDAIVCIAPSFAECLARWKIDLSTVSVIGNWASTDEVRVTPKANPWSRELGLEDTFNFLYSGTLGMKHRPELILQLAQHLEARDEGCVVVVAGGAGAEWLKTNCAGVDRKRLRVLPFQPYERISEVLGSSDVLLTLLDSGASTFAVPSKALSYLCAGRPQLVAAPSENPVSLTVLQADAGLVVNPSSPEALISAADLLIENRARGEEMGQNARRYAESNFEIKAITDRFEQVIENVCAKLPKTREFPSNCGGSDHGTTPLVRHRP